MNVSKRYVVQVAARNMGLLMRKLFGFGKPRVLQGAGSWLVDMVVELYCSTTLLGGRTYRMRASIVIDWLVSTATLKRGKKSTAC